MVDNKVKSGVYFIYNPDTKLIKIGCSNDIEKRYEDLQSQLYHLGYDTKLEMINNIRCIDYFELEKDLHKMFKKKRKINEWFDISINDIALAKNSINLTKYNAFNRAGLIGYSSINKDDCDLKMPLITSGLFSVIVRLSKNNKMENWLDILLSNIDLKERATRDHIKILSEYNLIKILNGVLYINPIYFSSQVTIRKDLKEIFGLKINKIDSNDYNMLFNLIECDNDKINSYF